MKRDAEVGSAVRSSALHPLHGRVLYVVLAALFAVPVAGAAAADAPLSRVPLCAEGRCAGVGDSAFPALVIGTVQSIWPVDAAATLFGEARSKGLWRRFPADRLAFARLVRIVEIRTQSFEANLPRPQTVAVMMTEYEYRDENLQPGTLVRYVSHDAAHEAPPKDQPELLPYWGVTGCVLPLCLHTDSACQARYLHGIFERETGVGARLQDGLPSTGPPLIHPANLLPLPN